MDENLLKIADRLHGVFFDKHAPEKRCVPPEDILTEVLQILNTIMPNKVISDLTPDDYHTIFAKIIDTHNYALNNIAPTQAEMLLIVDVFKYVIQVNNRWHTPLIVNDLWVLCLLYNIISYDNNQEAYLNKFKKWGAV